MPHVRITYCDSWGSSAQIRKFIAEILPKLKDHPEIVVELKEEYGAHPEILIDGNKLRTRHDKFDVLVQEVAKKLGLTLNWWSQCKKERYWLRAGCRQQRWSRFSLLHRKTLRRDFFVDIPRYEWCWERGFHNRFEFDAFCRWGGRLQREHIW